MPKIEKQAWEIVYKSTSPQVLKSSSIRNIDKSSRSDERSEEETPNHYRLS